MRMMDIMIDDASSIYLFLIVDYNNNRSILLFPLPILIVLIFLCYSFLCVSCVSRSHLLFLLSWIYLEFTVSSPFVIIYSNISSLLLIVIGRTSEICYVCVLTDPVFAKKTRIGRSIKVSDFFITGGAVAFLIKKSLVFNVLKN